MPRSNRGKNNQGSVNLAQKAAGKKPSAGNRKHKPSSATRTVIIAILITVIVGMLIFLIAGGIKVYQTIVSPRSNVEEFDPVSHTKTPSKYADKAAYYVLGLLGGEIDDPTEMLSILCWDKKKNTVNILQLPQDTYLGDMTM